MAFNYTYCNVYLNLQTRWHKGNLTMLGSCINCMQKTVWNSLQLFISCWIKSKILLNADNMKHKVYFESITYKCYEIWTWKVSNLIRVISWFNINMPGQEFWKCHLKYYEIWTWMVFNSIRVITWFKINMPG